MGSAVARVCSNCGQENPDHVLYCGRCAAPLAVDKEQVSHAAVSQAEGEATLQMTSVRDRVVRASRVVLIASAVLVVLTASALAAAGLDDPHFVGMVLASLGLFLASLFFVKVITSDKHIRFLRHRSFVTDVMAEAKGFESNLVIAIVAVAVAIGVAELMSSPSTQDLVTGYLVAGVIAVATFVSLAWLSRVTVEPGGICTGRPNAALRPFVPFGAVEHAVLSRHLLTIRLGERLPLRSRTMRIVVLSGAPLLASVLQKVLPPGKLSLVGVEAARDVGVRMRTCPECGETYDATQNACIRCGAVFPTSGYAYVGEERDYRPVYAGIALIVSSVFLAITGFMFFNMQSLFTRIYGRGPEALEMCGWIEMLFALVALGGGIASFQRRHLGLARAGAAVAIIGVGGTVSLVLGILAYMWLRESPEEFEAG